MSTKRKALIAAVGPKRKAYLAAHFLCEVCCKRQSVSVHEITRGPAREASLDEPDVLLAVCDGPTGCHRKLEDYSVWPPTRQLALKAIRSSSPPDLKLVNRLRGRANTAIEWADIAQHLTLE